MSKYFQSNKTQVRCLSKVKMFYILDVVSHLPPAISANTCQQHSQGLPGTQPTTRPAFTANCCRRPGDVLCGLVTPLADTTFSQVTALPLSLPPRDRCRPGFTLSAVLKNAKRRKAWKYLLRDQARLRMILKTFAEWRNRKFEVMCERTFALSPKCDPSASQGWNICFIGLIGSRQTGCPSC